MRLILLIGGSSSVGKTHLAHILSERLGIPNISVDQLRKQINDSNLRLLEGNDSIWDLPANDLLSRLFHEGLALEMYLYSLISSWLIAKKSRILEGEGVVPKLASQFAITSEVNPIFIIETDIKRLYQTLYGRSKAFQILSEPRRQRVCEMNSLYGEWLRSEAELYDLPWLPSQPWSSLPDRVLDIVSI